MTNKTNAPTVKVQNMIDNGMTVDLANGTTLVASWIDGYLTEDGIIMPHYTISAHSGYMPAFNTEKFDTIEELANVMRDCADLRTWKALEIES